MSMKGKDILAGVGGFFAFIGIIVLSIFLVIVFLKGATYLSTTVAPVLTRITPLLFITCLFIFLPFSLIKSTRNFGLISLVVSSFVFGALAWMIGFITTLYFWGIVGVVIGLFIAGIGVVPFGIIASFLNERGDIAWNLIALIVLAYGTRAFALWYENKEERAVGLKQQRQFEAEEEAEVEIVLMPNYRKKEEIGVKEDEHKLKQGISRIERLLADGSLTVKQINSAQNYRDRLWAKYDSDDDTDKYPYIYFLLYEFQGLICRAQGKHEDARANLMVAAAISSRMERNYSFISKGAYKWYEE